jgi:anaerobic ribonucleoside-triphosphate reductase
MVEVKTQMSNNIPDVRSSRGRIETFDPKKIEVSLVKETGMDKHLATDITDQVVKKIKQYGIHWLSGPEIREICCSILAERGLSAYRNKYTRVGIPVYDITDILSNGISENSNQTFNPESMHHWQADKVAEEYWLLRLPNDLADAHLKGDLHIHNLRYFQRPFCANWDLRMLFRNGLPPGGSMHFSNSKPASKPMVAFLHAAKWYGIAQGLFQGGQGYDSFCEFMSPFLVDLSDKEISQLAQCFVYETNQVYAARAQVPFTSIDTSPEISKELLNIPAVGPKGEIVGVYGDYDAECKKLFLEISKIYEEGDANNRLFNFPKHEVKLKKEWIEKHRAAYLQIMREASKMGSPYFLNHPDWMPAQLHSQCCRLIMTKEEIKKYCRNPDLFDLEKSYVNMGSLQPISINLPRIAYESNGNDAIFFDRLEGVLEKVYRLLFFKKGIFEDMLSSNRMDILGNMVRSPITNDLQPLFDTERYNLTVGHVGGNECAQIHTGSQLHESEESFNFLKQVLLYIAKRCNEESVERQYNINMWQQPAESTAELFALLDLERYGKDAIIRGDIQQKRVYYTNSDHFNYNAEIPLGLMVKKQAEFHRIVKGGVITHIWVGESHPNPEALLKLTQKIANTDTIYFAYTPDFTQCMNCMKMSNGIQNSCLYCGSDKVEWWSRITGYYSRVSRWNDGKKQELKDRNRYRI